MAQDETLERVGAVRLAVDHVHDLLLDLFGLGVAAGPVVSRASSVGRDEKVLHVIQVSVLGVLDRVDDARLQVEEKRARDVVIVVRLVEEDVLAVARVAVRGVLFQDAILADAVLGAQLFPKLRADLVAALANLKGDHLARHRARQPFDSDKR